MQLINMIMIYYLGKKQKKRRHVLEVDITIKNTFISCLELKGCFLPDVFQMTAIVLVSVIIHYHMNELHQFWDSQYL